MRLEFGGMPSGLMDRLSMFRITCKALQLPSVCDGPMRKKCKLTVLLMGGTNNPIVLTLASLFKLTFSYNKKEDVDSYSSVSKILPIIALKGRFCLLYSQLTE
ncbi:hypothetical protein ZWY2020_054934 [Hordeum vulgare]|nr:hypothetical protein ZWY2020_054934 [Hordeum vulgare]